MSSNEDHEAGGGACHGNVGNTYNITEIDDKDLNRILRKVDITPAIKEFELYCPAISNFCKPGQFIVVRATEKAERVPLTIADYSPEKGTITIVVQIVGVASAKINQLEVGDRFLDVVGPLGHESEIKNFGTVVCIGGGLGIAPVSPIQKALKEAGNKIYSISGGRSKEFIFWEERSRATSDKFFPVTDDGSYGEKGFVTDALRKLIESGEQIDRVIAIGPPIMMKVVADLTREYGIKTIVSLNSIMVDGTGMCGGCRVEVAGETKFTCVDGPEFDAHEVNFGLLFQRLGTYKDTERTLHSEYTEAQTEKKNKAKGRMPMPTQDPEVRRNNFEEVALGYTPEMAQAEASRCLQCKNPQCVKGCPVNVAIPEFIRLIAEGDFVAAAGKIKETNNLPAVCGRVCPQENQCEAKCILGVKGEPVAIGRLERFAADMEAAAGVVTEVAAIAPSGFKVAVVGAGPAGLAASADLARRGHEVTIFEALHTAGGVLAYGIPEFRLPKAIVKRECSFLEKLGIKFRFDMPIGATIGVPGLLESGFDAVFIGSGAGLPYFMDIPGENFNGVYSSNEFLTRINLMKAYQEDYDTPVLCRKNVAVIGGGNVAMDSARSALRLGADNVYILYRRSRSEMPARLEEVEHALEEGVTLKELTAPLEICGTEDGWVNGIRCQVMELGEPDDSGRRRPVPVAGEEYTIAVEEVIVAIGQGPNPILTRKWPELELNPRGNIKVDDKLMTSVAGVFSGGDIVTGAATVILAMGAGKEAAANIDEYLKNKKK